MEIVELYGKRYQVIMRTHRTKRQKSFHPVHRGAPGNLLGRQLTVIHGNGGRSEVADNWSETLETTGWTGYTVLLQRQGEVPDRPEQQRLKRASAAATQIDDEDIYDEGDGSFELVDDDDEHDLPAGQLGPQPAHGDLCSDVSPRPHRLHGIIVVYFGMIGRGR